MPADTTRRWCRLASVNINVQPGISRPRPPVFGGPARNTPGCAQCQGSRAEAVTAFNIFRIVANCAALLMPCHARLLPVLAAQASPLSRTDCTHRRQGRCVMTMPSASGRCWPFIATLVRSSHAALWLRAWCDQCLASSRMLSNNLRGRGVACGHCGLLARRQKPPLVKVADDAWFETPRVDIRAGARPPRTARHSRPTDCQPAPHSVVPAGKRKLQSRNRDFEPRTPV